MKVFKYRSGNSETFERDLESIQRNYVWASKISDLNDPCEAILSIERFKDQATSLVPKGNVLASERLKVVFSALDSLVERKNEIGVFSLSKTLNDELLWAHYGNCHKGFCIEYEFEQLMDCDWTDPPISFDVEYSDTPPIVEISDVANTIDNNLIKKLVSWKSSRWNYEQEKRIILQKAGEFGYSFDAVKAIHFGLNMPINKRERIVEKLEGRGIKFYEVLQKQGTYSFVSKAIKPEPNKDIRYLRELTVANRNCDSLKFSILEKTYTAYLKKGEIKVKLEKKTSKKQLEEIALKMKSDVLRQTNILFVFFYFEKQQDLDVAWGVAKFTDDNLNLSINSWVE